MGSFYFIERTKIMTETLKKKKNNLLYTKEQIKQAEQGSIVELAEKAGIALNQTGHDELKGIDHDSLVITPSKNAWFWNSRQVGGVGALSFAENYVLAEQNLNKGQKFKQAMKLINDNKVSTAEFKEQPKEPFKFNKQEISSEFKQAYAYLTKTRGINGKLVNQLHNQDLIEQDQNGDALFIWQNPENHKEVLGVTKQGTKINHKKYGKRGTFKNIEKNSTTNRGFCFDSLDIVNGKGVPENLRFFESSIDAMSFYNLNPKKLTNTRFVSMEGLKKNTVAQYLTQTEKQLNQTGHTLKSIAFGVDNDDAGNKFMDELAKYNDFVNAKGQKIKLESRQPSKKFGKDWNDVLKVFRQKQEQQRELDQTDISPKQRKFSNRELAKRAAIARKQTVRRQ